MRVDDGSSNDDPLSRPWSAEPLAGRHDDFRTNGPTARLDPAARIDRLLGREPVIWLSSIRPDGAPHLVPIWISWDLEFILVASKPRARKVANIRQNPSVMISLGEAEPDFDVGMLEGRAELLTAPASDCLPADHVGKYRDRMAGIGLTTDEFLATYSLVIRIRPTRFLPWHGRTGPASASIVESGVDARLQVAIPRVAAGLERQRMAAGLERQRMAANLTG